MTAAARTHGGDTFSCAQRESDVRASRDFKTDDSFFNFWVLFLGIPEEKLSFWFAKCSVDFCESNLELKGWFVFTW